MNIFPITQLTKQGRLSRQIGRDRPAIGDGMPASGCFNDSHSLFNEITELKEDLRHRLSLDCLDLAESYKQGNLNVIVDLRLGSRCCLTYTFAAMPRGWIGPLKGDPRDSGNNILKIQQVGMFIDQIEVVQGSEKIAIPSIVWLQSGHGVTDGLGNFFAFVPERDFEARFILAMGEIRAIRRLTRKNGPATHSLIKGASEIIEGVCGSESQVSGRVWNWPERNHQFPRLSISLATTEYTVGFREFLEGGAIICKVAFGPFNF
jgi:hypothetical protein